MKVLRNVLIIVELGILIIIALNIYQKLENNNKILGSSNASVLNKEDYSVSTESGTLKYFYELRANSRILESYADWLPRPVAYTINLDSLNDRYDYDIKKQNGVYRILTLGDSFTFGHFVNTSDNWTEILEDKLNNLTCQGVDRFEVINLGVAGYGPEYIVKRFEMRGIKYSPDMIIWNESGNGFERVNELLEPLIKKYDSPMTQEERKEVLNKGQYPTWTKAYDELYKHYGYDKLKEMVRKSWEEFFELRKEVPVLITSFDYLTADKKAILSDYSQNNSGVYLYIGLPHIYDENLTYPDGHPNVDGHSAIALSTFEYLKANFLPQCSP